MQTRHTRPFAWTHPQPGCSSRARAQTEAGRPAPLCAVEAPAPRPRPVAGARPPRHRPRRAEPLLRRFVPVAAGLFLLLLLGLSLDATLRAYYLVEPNALAELDAVGQLAADDVHAALRRVPPGAPPSIVLDFTRRALIARGRSVLLTDRGGMILAALPASAEAGGPLADRLGGTPLAVLGEKAGAMRVTGPTARRCWRWCATSTAPSASSP